MPEGKGKKTAKLSGSGPARPEQPPTRPGPGDPGRPGPDDSSSKLTIVLLRTAIVDAQSIEMVPTATGELELRITYKAGRHAGIDRLDEPLGSPKPERTTITVHGKPNP
jgi:hypothetical protein